MNVRKKLSEKSGVSILFALLLLLVVAMVSVVMISASVSAVKRTHAKKVVVQKSVSIDSAALLLKNQISDSQPESGFVLTYSEDGKYVISVNSALDNSALKSEITDISQKFANGVSLGQFDSVSGFKIITSRSGDLKDDVVNVSCSIQPVLNNSAEVTFTLSDGDEVLYSRFSLTLSGGGTSASVKWLWKEASTKDAQAGGTNG